MITSIHDRIVSLNWGNIHEQLDNFGFAKLPMILDEVQREKMIQTYENNANFRTTINMKRYRFGEGEYKYYDYALPAELQQLRESFYPELANAANRWLSYKNKEALYPDALEEFLDHCHKEGQERPTPLILQYVEGGYNCMHQDLYGKVFFPFQVVFALNQRGDDYTGGESILVEQRPRAQSRGHVVTLEAGEGLIFTTNNRPVKGTKGYYQSTMRHGVSTLTSGTRYGLGVIFHDAE